MGTPPVAILLPPRCREPERYVVAVFGRVRAVMQRWTRRREECEFFDEWDRQGWEISPADDDAYPRCRVCGPERSAPPWSHDGQTPSCDFCACCGTQFRSQDVLRERAARARCQWLEAGSWARGGGPAARR